MFVVLHVIADLHRKRTVPVERANAILHSGKILVVCTLEGHKSQAKIQFSTFLLANIVSISKRCICQRVRYGPKLALL